jgi:hypothetical protein
VAGFTVRAADLPAEIARLASFNAVSVPPDYVTEALTKLRERFLRPVEPPAPVHSGQAGHRLMAVLRIPQLSGESVRMGVQLSWTVAAEVDHFELERSHNLEFDVPIRIYRGAAHSFVDDRPGAGTRAHYRVRAVTDGSAGPWSRTVHLEVGGVAAPPARPAADAPPTLTGRRADGAVLLEWTRVWLAVQYQVIRLGPLDIEPPADVFDRVVYRGSELSCRLSTLSATAGPPSSFCVRGLDATGRPRTDWSERTFVR